MVEPVPFVPHHEPLKVTRRNAVLAVLTRCGRWERQHGDARKRAAVCLTQRPTTGYPRQKPAIDGHDLPGYLIKWKDTKFTLFDTREEMERWFLRARSICTSNRDSFMPLEVVYDGQRCGFYADIECIIPRSMPQGDEDALKAAIILHANHAYAARGLDSDARAVERKPSRAKISFHVVGLDVDFEGTKNDSHLAHVAKKMNRDCIELTQRYPLVDFSECGRTGRKQNLFDLAVYSSNRAMRTIFSSKNWIGEQLFHALCRVRGERTE